MLLSLWILAFFAACRREPPMPELHLGAPGDPSACTLAAEQRVFGLQEPFAFVFDNKGPFGINLLEVRVIQETAEKGRFEVLSSEGLRVLPGHERFCAVDPKLTGERIFGTRLGAMSLQVVKGGRVLASAPFEVSLQRTMSPQPAPPAEPAASEEAAKAPSTEKDTSENPAEKAGAEEKHE